MVGDENQKKNWSGTMKRRFWTQSCWCSKCTPTSFKVQSRQFKVQFKVKPRLSPKRCNETKKWHCRNLRPKKIRLSGIFPVIFKCSKDPKFWHTQFSSMFNRWVQCSNQPVQCSDIVQSSARHRSKKSGKETIPCWTAAHRASRRLKKTVAEQRTIPKGG